MDATTEPVARQREHRDFVNYAYMALMAMCVVAIGFFTWKSRGLLAKEQFKFVWMWLIVSGVGMTVCLIDYIGHSKQLVNRLTYTIVALVITVGAILHAASR